MNLFIEMLWTNPHLFIAIALVVVFSVCCHEFMHAWTALKVGDSTAADAGHLTLNPLRQMGFFSLIMLAFIGIAWGQVPVNPSRMRGKYAPALVAFAGPGTNLALFLLFALGSALTLRFGGEASHFAGSVLLYGAMVNLVLFCLNLLPIPGFDGGAILLNFFPRFSVGGPEWVRGIFLAIVLLLFLCIDYLFRIAALAAVLLQSVFLRLLN